MNEEKDLTDDAPLLTLSDYKRWLDNNSMSEYLSYLLYCLTTQKTLVLVAMRLKPTDMQRDALKYYAEGTSKPIIKALIPPEYIDLDVIKVEEIFEVFDLK